MPDTKISDLTVITAADIDGANDLITVVDMSETGAARNKKMTFTEATSFINPVLTNIVEEQSATYQYFAGDEVGGTTYKALRYDVDNNLTTNTDVIANKPGTLAQFEALSYS